MLVRNTTCSPQQTPPDVTYTTKVTRECVMRSVTPSLVSSTTLASARRVVVEDLPFTYGTVCAHRVFAIEIFVMGLCDMNPKSVDLIVWYSGVIQCVEFIGMHGHMHDGIRAHAKQYKNDTKYTACPKPVFLRHSALTQMPLL